MAEVLIISGAGCYSDPWHTFADTSQCLADIIAGLDHDVTVSEAVEHALEGHLGRGGALLGLHVSATSMTTMSGWSQMLGGHWVRGRTMHPEQDLATILVRVGAHPIVRGLVDFTVFDERYSYLHTNPDTTVVCESREWSTTGSATTPGPTKVPVTWSCCDAPWDGSYAISESPRDRDTQLQAS